VLDGKPPQSLPSGLQILVIWDCSLLKRDVREMSAILLLQGMPRAKCNLYDIGCEVKRQPLANAT